MKKWAGLLALFLLALGLCSLLLPAKPKPHKVKLIWNAPTATASSAIAGYNVYRSTSSRGPYVKIASKVAATTYSDSLVVSGRTYYYVVTTVDQAGRESGHSNETVSVIP